MSLIMALALAQAAAPAQDCQAAIGSLYEGREPARLPNQVDGSTIGEVAELVRLRAARGNAPLVVNGGNFANGDFRAARLVNICFVGTNLAGSDWRNADAPGLAFINANLEGARLAGARMPRVLLRQPNLANVDASGADWSGGAFDGGWDASVDGLRLEGANLTGFRFDCGITIADGCPLGRDMRFPGANLTGASLATYQGSWDWAGARIDRTEVSLAQLLDLSAADLHGPIRVRGGDTIVELSPAEYRRLRPHISDGLAPAQASFDCSRAASPVERQICGDEGIYLRELDAHVADLYRRARAADPAVAASQQAWLRARARCGADAGCIDRAYHSRKDQLLGALGAPGWTRPGAYALFVQPELRFAAAFQDDPLYRRLLPVVIDGSSARVVVRINADGSMNAGGDAVGANAHLCSLGGERLRLDRSNGWYSGPIEDDSETPAAWRGRPMPVLRFRGDVAEVYRNGQGGFSAFGDPRPSDYASCGMRASFSDLVRVPVTQDEAKRLLDSYRER